MACRVTPSTYMGGLPRRLHLLLVLVAAHRGGAVQAGGQQGEAHGQTVKLMRSESEDSSSQKQIAEQRAGVAAAVQARGASFFAESVSAAQSAASECAPCALVQSLVGTMAAPVIPDKNIKFSSAMWREAWVIRLDNDKLPWCPWMDAANRTEQWVSFTLMEKSLITEIVTMGNAGCCSMWVTKYDVYADGKKVGSYDGNADSKHEVAREMNPTFVATEVKISPKAWNNHIAMRADILGCECVPTTTTTTAATAAKGGATGLRAGCGLLVAALLALAGAPAF